MSTATSEAHLVEDQEDFEHEAETEFEYVEVAEGAIDNVLAIAAATAPNRSSMGQDVDARRITEIDAINGFIVRRAEELGIEVPVNLTLVHLIKTVQNHYPGSM